MQHAIALARRSWGQTHPNPLVGAVIVENGIAVAEGWHEHDGGPHAEIMALRALGRAPAAGTTMYVTLEPCSTHGRTGACTEAIGRAGISRVVIGATDPNPAHRGRGVGVLLAKGIRVSHGVLAEECTDLNLIFNHRICTGQPLIAAKVAMTLDGKIATRDGHSRWITGAAARADVMQWRRYFPAIGVGAGTVLADNPSLTARTASSPAAEATAAAATHSGSGAAAALAAPAGEIIHCPQRFIFDRSGHTAQVAASAAVYTDAFASHTHVITEQGAAAQKLAALQQAGISIHALPREAFLAENFAAALREQLGALGQCGLYVEGGGGLLSHLLAANALDYLFCYRAPKLLADAQAISPFTGQSPLTMDQAATLRDVRHAVFGDDQLIRGHLHRPVANA